MPLASKIAGTAQAWENEQLGADAAHAKIDTQHDDEIDAALELQPISIRLHKGLIDNLKALGQLHGLGYQPLVRQILTRFVECEMKNLLKQRVAEQEEAVRQSTVKATPTKVGGGRKSAHGKEKLAA